MDTPANKKGRLVVIEGIDGAGKSTLAARIPRHLHGSILVHEPWHTVYRDLLATTEHSPRARALVFCADRVELYHAVVRPALGRGMLVISDRSWISTAAYQGDAEAVRRLTVQMVGRAAMPDLVLYLDATPEVALPRMSPSDRARGAAYYAGLRESYRQASRGALVPWVTLDASRPADVVLALALQCIRQVIDGDMLKPALKYQNIEALRCQEAGG